MEQQLSGQEQISKSILGSNYYMGVFAFFQAILRRNHKDIIYISFITRRCSCLAFLFLQFFVKPQSSELKLTGVGEDTLKISYADKELDCALLTDGALITLGWKIGQQIYQTQNCSELSEITLVDDSISYGRSLTNVLDRFTAKMRDSIEKAAMKDSSPDFDSKLQGALAEMERYRSSKIHVCVYAEKDQTALLPPLYQTMLQNGFQALGQRLRLPHYQWNDYSTRLSELINCSDIANAAFVISVGVNGETEAPSGWETVDWHYQEHHQRTYFVPLPAANSDQYSAVCSVRRIECGAEHRYRLIPFLFMPKLSMQQLNELERRVFDRLYEFDIIPKPYAELHTALEEQLTLRSRLDFVTTYLSHSILCAFDPELPTWDDAHCDRWKIMWNYNQIELNESDSNKVRLTAVLTQLCQKKNREALLSMEELQGWIRDLNCQAPFIENQQKMPICQKIEDQSLWNELLEEFLFELAIDVEQEAHNTVMSNVRPGSYTLQSLNSRRYQNFSDFQKQFKTFLSGALERRNISGLRELSTLELLSAILMLMDSGAMAVVSDVDEYTKCSTPQIRLCEQAMASQPRRFFLHLDALFKLEKQNWLSEEQKQAYLQGYTQRLEAAHLIGYGEAAALAKQLLHFYNQMRQGAQKINYWAVGMNRHFKVCHSDTGPGNGVDEIGNSRELRKQSMQYGAHA